MSSVKATQFARHGHPARGQLFTIFSVDHRTPGNKARLDADAHEKPPYGCESSITVSRGEFVDRAILDEVDSNTCTTRATIFHFMNTRNYEQMQMRP